ncbi:putative transcription factor interactor and regulator CCHC(Zn) family [Helianthus annuus]|nr:putative transcription factor interactor and regulator CCHC(Zn) family [Helianthus annuus]
MLIICLLCRQRGHSLKNCPDKNEENIDKTLCYNCGEFGHSLASCLQPLQDGNLLIRCCFD